jgi:EmrB/QacA subfamily drug resistance transporter
LACNTPTVAKMNVCNAQRPPARPGQTQQDRDAGNDLAMTVAPPPAVAGQSAILAIIMVSYIMIVLDISIIITGLPKIREELGFSDAGLAWVSSAYTLTFGGFLLLGARAGDILGRRLMFVAGLVVFAIASLFIGLAQTPAWIITARAVQGIGSAILAPSTLALLQTNFPAGPSRTRAIAYYAAAAGISASFGLVLGGVLADWLSWRVGFFINLPVALGLIVAAYRYIAETERRSGVFDLAGAMTSTIGMSGLVFGLVASAAYGWADPVTVGSIAAGALLLLVFVIIETRATHPIMPLRLFNSRERSGAYIARVLFLGANVGFFFFATQYMQGVLGYSPALTGLAFLPAMIVNFASALRVPQMAARFGAARLLTGSMIISLLGMYWLSFVSSQSTYWDGLAIPMLMIGLGQGGAVGPLTNFGISGVDGKDAGAASGLVNAAHQLGSSLGLAVLVAVSVIASGTLTGTELLTHRVTNAMIAATVMIALALVVVFTMIPRRQPALAN